MTKHRENSWIGIGDEIGGRVRNAFVSLPFIASFLIGVLLISGIGIWLPYSLDKSGNATFLETQNLLTYSLAFLGTMVVDLLLSNKKDKDLTSLSLIVGCIAAFLLIYGYLDIPKGFSWLVTAGSVITIIMFIFFTVNDPKYDSKDTNEKDDKDDVGVDGYKDVAADKIKDQS